MLVQLIAHTNEPEKTVAAAAKLCYSDAHIETLLDGLTPDKTAAFLQKLTDLGHASPIEHASFTFGIEGVSRTFLAQVTRHRIGSFCLSGDTIVGYQERNRGMTVKQLAQKTNQYKRMSKLRSVDESTKEIFYNNVVDAWYSGKKPVYEVKTEDGYSIKTTQDHQFFVGDSYKPLMELREGDIVYTNGITAYKNRDWLEAMYWIKGLSQEQIANICEVSKHTIRSWIAKFNLQKPLGSWCIGKKPPNFGQTKNTYEPMMRTSIKMSGNSNSNGRVYTSQAPKTISGGYWQTHKKYKKSGICSMCGETGKTELHHIDKNPMNVSPDNVVELCCACHKRQHNGMAIMACKPSKILSIKFVGIEDTYDVEMQAPYNNFVANGFIVHNCVQSQRYVRLEDFRYVVPPEIAAIPEAKAQFIDAMNADAQKYLDLVQSLEQAHTKRLMAEGLDEKAARAKASKQANEDARFVLPNACETKMVMTMNCRSLQNFFNLRCCNRAQWEIRAVADEMLRLVLPLAPHIFAAAGPRCLTGPCPEGRMCCGQMEQVRRKYAQLKQEADQ